MHSAGPIKIFGRGLFSVFLVTFVEFVDTTCSIHQYVLTGIERVRSIGDLKFNHWILVPVFPGDGFAGRSGGFAQEAIPIGHVFKHYESIIFRMNSLFHINKLINTERKGKAIN